jgi:hypothetical protein
MTMRKIAFLGVLIAVVGIGAWYGIPALSSRGAEHGLDLALRRLPSGWTVTYKSATFGIVSDRAALHGVEIHGVGAIKLDARIEELDLAGLSVDLGSNWVEAVRNPTGMAPETALPVADSIALKGADLDLNGQSFTLGSARITKLRLYPWALLHEGVPTFNEIAALARQRGAEPKPQDMLPLLRLIAAYALGVGYDSYGIDNLAARVRMPVEDAGPTEIAYAAKRIDIGAVDRGRVADAALDGLAVTAAPGSEVKIDHAGLGSLDLRPFWTQILSGAALDSALLDGAGLGKLDYAGVSAKTPEGTALTLTGIGLSNLGFAHGLPASAEFSVTGMKIAKAQVIEPKLRNALALWGLDVATVNFGGSYKWDAEKKTAAVQKVNLDIAELGALTLSAELAGIEKSETVDQTAALDHAVLRYTDASLVGRALKLFPMGGTDPSKGGTDPSITALRVSRMLQYQAAALLGDSPAVAAATRAIGIFLTDPHNLTFEFTPPEPLRFHALDAALGSDLPPAEIFAKFGVTVTANQ